MKKLTLFLHNLSKDQKEFLNLLDLTAKVHGENKISGSAVGKVIWGEEFHRFEKTSAWKDLSETSQKEVLLTLGNKIFQEAYFIEQAGMAYAGKMNLSSKSKEEREFFCFVAEEEAKHLRMIEALGSFSVSLDSIPSFSMLIGEIIQEASKSSHLLLIQILLEGWGLNYYKSLAKHALDENVVQVFKAILKDEIRHHSGGVILFSHYRKTYGMSASEVDEFLGYLDRLAFMVKIGPYSACEEVFKRRPGTSKEDLKKFLIENEAIEATNEKMELLGHLLLKGLPDSVVQTISEKKILDALNLDEMTEVLFQSLPGVFSSNS